jgi:hypothetical protein
VTRLGPVRAAYLVGRACLGPVGEGDDAGLYLEEVVQLSRLALLYLRKAPGVTREDVEEAAAMVGSILTTDAEERGFKARLECLTEALRVLGIPEIDPRKGRGA